MCRTSAPPRRDLYELEQSITTDKPKSAAEQGGFLVPKTKPGRIGSPEWHKTRPGATAIYNANFTPGGRKYANYSDPWTVIGPDIYTSFETITAALTFAFKKAAATK